MNARWCFQCGASYEASVPTCVECGVGLVDEPPKTPEEVGSPEEAQLAYDLHEWSFEARRMLDQLLTGREVVHAWQGASLIVREHDEATVDALVDEADQAAQPALDPEQGLVVYEMAEWPADHQMALAERLGSLGLPHEFDASGDLVVHAEDEERVDAILDEIELSTPSADGAGPALDLDLEGLEVNDLLSELFGAADRIRRAARDPGAVRTFLERVEVLGRVRSPFGFEPREWRGLLARTEALRDLLHDDASDEEAIREHAGALRDELVQLI